MTPANNKLLINSQFSPVTVAESPVKKILQCGNLTGNVRRIRDLAAELYNLIQDWNTHHILGTQILNNIMEIKSPILIENAANESSIIYAEKLEEQCEKLDETVRNMNDIVMKLIEGSQQMHSVEKLEYPSSVKKAPLFITWPISKYGEVIGKICDAYECEVRAKTIVKESVAHSRTNQELKYYIITWVHQPYVDTHIELLLESLLQETGHR
ncbi:hypothetical protein L9F63_025891 [Diploptera punctata]|uniref:Cyclin-dependent kinase 2-interacting protein n=1 Tax=Diploptera punctata TaxID=6984 RepID=A0AAD8E2S7_DIPPU|nr:hypothetical protein L9F63_025891 [Diploptera punctata]